MTQAFLMNVLHQASLGWQEVLKNEDNFVLKKEQPRGHAGQLFYKLSKFFTSVRDPTNFLVLYDKRTQKETEFLFGRHEGVIVRGSVQVVPPETDFAFEQYNHVFAEFDPHPIAWLSLYVQAKHFYNDTADRECPELADQVREKYGKRYFSDKNIHVSGWRPQIAFDRTFLRAALKKKPLDELLDYCIDLHTSAGVFKAKYWTKW